jgi:ribosomal protein L7/L12
MQLESITVAANGFVLYEAYGRVHIAKTLLEAAQLTGEAVPNPSATHYATGYNSNDLNNVKGAFKEGRKIDAIKLLRDCFSPRLGLREAKDLIECLCA